MSLKALIEEIHSSFEDSELPAEDNIVNPKWVEIDLEISDINKRFRNKRWQELSVEDMTAHRNLAPFTPEGFAYFLPAYLLLLLLNPKKADVLNDSVLYDLNPPADGEYANNRFCDLVGRLTGRRKQAIRKFLTYLVKHRARWFEPRNLPQRALDLYWGQF